jgi:glycosyltransferase involved in cell wall biosynthesis
MKPFSIIVPVYNEEEILQASVEALIRYADPLAIPYEIILVSNGSTDGSDKAGSRLQEIYPHLRFFSLPQKGVGRAFKKGIAQARYDHLIFIDADLSADLVFIERANKLLNEYALVLGAKIKGLQNRGIIRKLGSFIFYLSVLSIMGLKYVDYAPGAKAYRKDFVMKYLKYIDDYTSFVLNLAFIAKLKKEPVVEIPIACEDKRKSRFNLLREAVSKYQGLFSLKFAQLCGRL